MEVMPDLSCHFCDTKEVVVLRHRHIDFTATTPESCEWARVNSCSDDPMTEMLVKGNDA